MLTLLCYTVHRIRITVRLRFVKVVLKVESERREILAFFWRAWRSPNVAPVGELDGPRE